MLTGPLPRARTDVARLCPLPVGVILWRGPDPRLTVVVKATFSIAADGIAPLAPEQDPLALDCPSPIGDRGDLDQASDFAPWKARADVLLAGQAHAPVPAQVHAAGFAVDGLRKRFYALSAEPVRSVPLLPKYLRSAPTAGGAPVRVGALAVWARRGPEARLVSPHGVLAADIPASLDQAAFNVAPPDQQLDRLSAAARLTLEGLVADGGWRSVRLPGVEPRVFAAPPRRTGDGRAPEEIAMRCDTLWIDADRELCTLTFRGVLRLAEGAPRPTLVVALAAAGERPAWADLKRRLGDASFEHAVEPDDLRVELVKLDALDEETFHSGKPPGGAAPGAAATTRTRASGAVPFDPKATTKMAAGLPAFDAKATTKMAAGLPAFDPTATARRSGADLDAIAPRSSRDEAAFDSAATAKMPAGGSASRAAALRAAASEGEPLDDADLIELSAAPGGPEEETTGVWRPPLGGAARAGAEVRGEVRDRRGPPATLADEGTMDAEGAWHALVIPPPLPFVPASSRPAADAAAAPPQPAAQGRRPTTRRVTRSKTETVDLDPATVQRGLRAVLPFHADADAVPPTQPASQGSLVLGARGATLSSHAAEPPPVSSRPETPRPPQRPTQRPAAIPLPTPPEPAADPPFRRPAAITLPTPPQLAADPLPFSRRAPLPTPPARTIHPPPAPATPSAPRPPLPAPNPPEDAAPALTAGPVKPAPPPAAAVSEPLLSLATYAAIKVALWADRSAHSDLLALHGLDEETWHTNERRLAAALQREAMEGSHALSAKLREALRAARDRPSPDGERPLGSIEGFAELCAAIEAAPDRGAALAARGITPAEWHRMHRRFHERLAADAKLRRAFSDKLAVARRAAGEDRKPPAAPAPGRIRRERPPAAATRVAARKPAS